MAYSNCSSWVLVLGSYGQGIHSMFTKINIENLRNFLHGKKTVELDLEAEFSSSALDIIGLGVFNYDSVSVTKESPVINGKANSVSNVGI
ncbi:hypothetical protein SADUNF_Sadunf17G0063300 [Salix dunnii]|uniref:Uncharacterized protein n=1 Tax=Salix dunnii TaxID=1413687 RepID=A0A835J5Q2_9ROSI|nr:hypothetical protein SADUNF_Sadunf17G0063300 [Salix dunnii]